MTERWYPEHAHGQHEAPTVGRLVALEHAVWRVTRVKYLPLTDADRDVWLGEGCPDIDTWLGRPYRLSLVFMGGARPEWVAVDKPVPLSAVTVRAFRRWAGPTWNLYPESGRWPQCSCCGEPMPCRAELEDREVGEQLDVVEKFASRMPGCCWGCGEPITSRQKAVTYPGDNLDLPGGQPVRFHARRGCRYYAEKYELRWIAADPRNERVLTWPKCGGILVVHHDGSSECVSGPGPFGGAHTSEPNCEGHLTHDHGATSACYVAGDWFAANDWPGCPRGCAVEGHPGARPSRRPERRQQDSLLGGTA